MLDSEAGTETSAPSIEDSLAAAFGAETPPETSGTTAEVSAPVPPASGEPNAALAALEAPKHWSEVDRTLFGKAPRDIQQRWIDREAEQTRGLDTKFQEIAGFRREREQYDEILAPFKRDLELSGQNGPQFVKSLVGWMNYLQTNPTEGLPKLMQTLGLDPKQLLQPEANTDPKYSELENRTKDLQKQLETFTSQAQQRDHQQKLSEVQAFADAKGEDGKPLRPYFDEVSKDILQLMGVAKQQGAPITLDTAYNKALRMNDTVWEKVQLEKAQATQAAKDKERLAAVEKAKKAASTNGSGSGSGQAKKLTLEQELEAKFDNYH